MAQHYLALFLTFLTILPRGVEASQNSDEASSAPPHFVHGCFIHNRQGQLIGRTQDGFCVYLPDGRYFTGNNRMLSFYNAHKGLIWRKKINVHHQVRLASDKKSILFLGSRVEVINGERVRYDVVLVYDFNGNELKSYDFFKNSKEVLKHTPARNHMFRGKTVIMFREPPAHMTEEDRKVFVPVHLEASHANSVHEIGEMPPALTKKIPAFKKGNYIVNVNGLGTIFILDSKLKRILWSTPQPTAEDDEQLANVHDVQVTKEGNLLYYNNQRTRNSSAIEEMDPLTLKRTRLYQASPPETFFARIQGGVQKLDNGHLLITENRETTPPRIFEVDAKGKVVWQIIPTDGGDSAAPVKSIQDARMTDLSEFLSKNWLF